MWCAKFVAVVLLLLFGTSRAQDVTSEQKLFCYYDGSFSQKDEHSRVTVREIADALPFCTHLIYGYAGLNATTLQLVPQDSKLDLDSGKGQYRDVTTLKRRYPGLKVFLSVGGNRAWNDPLGKRQYASYLSLLESESARKAFVERAHAILMTYDFDGLDLAWQFPQSKPRRIRDATGKLWHGFKKLFTGDSILDPKADEHREEFTVLVRDLRIAFEKDRFQLMYTQLPHVNQTIFLDIPLLKDNLDFVNVATYDQQTPVRNPFEGDFYAPIYEAPERVPGNSIDGKVKAWTSQGTEPHKIVVGMASYGRGWKLTVESGSTGEPPIRTDGPSAAGPYTETDGLYSFGEVSFRLRDLPVPTATFKGAHPLAKVEDTSARFGPYAYRLPTGNQIGLWLSYESLASAGHKASYVTAHGLGGISINDLALDDYRGLYYEEKFPLLRTVYNHFHQLNVTINKSFF